jgi:hypothetical protein
VAKNELVRDQLFANIVSWQQSDFSQNECAGNETSLITFFTIGRGHTVSNTDQFQPGFNDPVTDHNIGIGAIIIHPG